MGEGFEIAKYLGSAASGMSIMYLWVRSLQADLKAEREDRKVMTGKAIEAVEKSAGLAEAGIAAQNQTTTVLIRIEGVLNKVLEK